MGMFDELTIEYPFPDAEFQGDTFQTKDLECMLWRYKITVEGQLLQLHGHWENTPEVPEGVVFAWQLPHAAFEEHMKAWENAVWVEEHPTLIDDMHGDIYISASRGANQDWRLYRWRVRFTHGKVESITAVEGW